MQEITMNTKNIYINTNEDNQLYEKVEINHAFHHNNKPDHLYNKITKRLTIIKNKFFL